MLYRKPEMNITKELLVQWFLNGNRIMLQNGVCAEIVNIVKVKNNALSFYLELEGFPDLVQVNEEGISTMNHEFSIVGPIPDSTKLASELVTEKLDHLDQYATAGLIDVMCDRFSLAELVFLSKLNKFTALDIPEDLAAKLQAPSVGIHINALRKELVRAGLEDCTTENPVYKVLAIAANKILNTTSFIRDKYDKYERNQS